MFFSISGASLYNLYDDEDEETSISVPQVWYQIKHSFSFFFDPYAFPEKAGFGFPLVRMLRN